MDTLINATLAAARDVINADILRAAIVRRSRNRKDHADISRWLQTHFFRWTINAFPHVLPVRSVDGWRLCVGETPPPPWFLGKLAAVDSSMIYIDPEHHLLRDRETRMVEFFNARLDTRLAGKFHRVSFTAADAAWSKDHERMQRRSRRGWWPSQAHALSEVVATAHGRFVELQATGHALRAEMAYESFHMQHCLGQFADHERLVGGYGEQYARSCEQGRARLFSLRDGSNRPHVTVSLVEDLGEWSLDQIKGKQNTTPDAKYAPDVLCLLNVLRPRDAGSFDSLRLGLVAQSEADEVNQTPQPDRVAYVNLGELRDAARRHALLGAFPHLLGQCPRPDPLSQWLSLAGGGDILDDLAAPHQPHGPVLAALQAMRSHTASAPADPRLSAKLADVFPQWRAGPIADDDIAASQDGWLRRLLTRTGASTVSRAQPHRRWALAVPELLFYRLGMDGGSARLRVAAPTGTPDRLRSQIESELAIDGEDDGAATRRFCESFFRVPYFSHATLLSDPPSPPLDAARDLLAWHAMRQSYLLRLQVAWGRLQEAQAWPLLLLNAQRVQDCCQDWSDFGAAAARGHARWLGWNGREAHLAKATEVALKDFQDESACPWRRLSWSAFDLAQAVAARPTLAAV